MDKLEAALRRKDTVDPPFAVDEEAKAKYLAAIEEVRELSDKGWVRYEATDIDSLEPQHLIKLEWTDDLCDARQRETQILRDLLSLDGEACIAEQGKVWIVGIPIYSHVK